jgi:Rrf2 family protein
MKLSSQEEYGLRCLLFMASQGPNANLSIPEISRAEGLSIPNVAKLMRILRIGGFVRSLRGQTGGYTLVRPPQEITVGAVLDTLGGRLFGPRFCERHAGLSPVCNHNTDCSLRSVWSTLQDVIERVLQKMTLQDLMHSEGEMRQLMHIRVQESKESAGVLH